MTTIERILENELKKLAPEERETLRGEVLLTFNILYSNIINKMNSFESTILDTSIERNKDLSIVNMIVPKEDFYLFEENFSPVIPEDKNTMSIFSKIQEQESLYEKIVYVGDLDKIDEYDGYEFEGELNLEGKISIFKLKLVKDNSYKGKLEELYKTFQLNFLKWKTVNAPYLNRIFRIEIIEYEENLIEELANIPEVNEITSLKIRDEIIKKYFAQDHITIWNISHAEKFGNGLIQPTENRINYIHTITSNDDVDLYLVPETGVHVYSIGKTSTGFRIVTDTNKDIYWKFISVSDVSKIKYDERLKYPVFDNYEISLFINKLKSLNKVRIRTVAEIHRIVNSYENIKKRFELIDVEITDKIKESEECKDLDYFIIDEFKLKKDTKYIYLYFEVIKKDIFLIEELSFIITMMQSFFPEYQCKGVLK